MLRKYHLHYSLTHLNYQWVECSMWTSEYHFRRQTAAAACPAPQSAIIPIKGAFSSPSSPLLSLFAVTVLIFFCNCLFILLLTNWCNGCQNPHTTKSSSFCLALCAFFISLFPSCSDCAFFVCNCLFSLQIDEAACQCPTPQNPRPSAWRCRFCESNRE